MLMLSDGSCARLMFDKNWTIKLGVQKMEQFIKIWDAIIITNMELGKLSAAFTR
jgi:hypothetical protein